MTGWADIRARVLYEDEGVVVLDKPPGISVVGERHADDLSDLARAAGEWLMPAHRIDKVTSGAVVFAKTPEVHASLARQFNRRAVEKAYLAVVHGTPPGGVIDLPLAVGRKNRMRVAGPRASIVHDPAAATWTLPPGAVDRSKRHYPSTTRIAPVGDTGLVVAQPVTGRRHQIRVHLAWIGFPIVGDPLFDTGEAPRTYLHAWQVAFEVDGRQLTIVAPPDETFWAPLPDADPSTLLALADRA